MSDFAIHHRTLNRRELRERLKALKGGVSPDRIRVTARSGREVRADYSYSRIPGEKRPTLLTLLAEARKPDGEETLWAVEFPVLGRLNKWELARLVEEIDARCAATERGEPDGADVNVRDITKTDFWQAWPHDEVKLTPGVGNRPEGDKP